MGAGRHALYLEMGLYEFLQQKKAEGKISQLGFSFHDDASVLGSIACLPFWDFAQIQLNYLDWTMQDAKGEYETLQRHNLPVVIMEPVRGGALHTLCPEAIGLLKRQDADATAASWAVRYCASLPSVMTVLSGMTTMEHVKDNVKTMTDFKPLNDAEYALLEKVVEIYQQSKTVPCTACRYCMDCPAGVDIPLMFTLHNQLMLTEDRKAFVDAYKAAGTAKQAHACVSCRVCCEHCPQHIDIPAELSKVNETAQKLIPAE